MRRLILLSALAIVPCVAKPTISPETLDPQCFFVVPSGWNFSAPDPSSSHVKVAFIKKGSKGFSPSINLAIEETSASPSDYLKAVRSLHEQNRDYHWRALGKVRTSAGLGQLTEIDAPSPFGPVRMLQLIVMKEGKAYVLTAAALKEEIQQHYKDFQSAFRSFTLTSDLFSAIPQLERREALKEKQNQLLDSAQESDASFHENHWIPFQNFIANHFEDMGLFWQALCLKNIQEKISQSPSKLETNSPSELEFAE